MTTIPKDKDPILEQKFFEFLFPLAYPDIPIGSDIYNFCKDKLSMEDAILPAGTLLEKAISVQKRLTRHSTIGRDFVDGSDAKSASCRWYSNLRSYGAPIHDIYNKKGLLRCVVYERLADKFYFFLIPHAAYANIPKTSNIEIPFNLDGTPRRNAKNIRNIDWWQFEVPSFSDILKDLPNSYEFAKDKKERIKAEKKAAQKILLDSLLERYSLAKTKIDPNVQISTPCTEDGDQSQNQGLQEILPTSLSS